MRVFLIVIALVLFKFTAWSQGKNEVPKIEPCNCQVAIDSSYKHECGYLIVPENRKRGNGKMIKLPFIIARSNNPNKKNDPLLYTAGGPGGSSLRWITGVGKRGIIDERDCIAFEQRGTYFALPRLSSPELSNAIRESYRKNLPKDSMVLVGVKRMKKALEAKGIDLAGYNTDETVADMHDLLKALHIDSVNLFGGSYSGGLMLAVLQRDPSRIRSLVLDSPLPTFIPIDEDEPANFNEALTILFSRCEKDSAGHAAYANLKTRFYQYFNSIANTAFYCPYLPKDAKDTLQVEYRRSDLLNIVVNALYDPEAIKDIPYLITQLIGGHHQPYIHPVIDHIFNGNNGPSGMRLAVYCADQTAYHSEAMLQQSYIPYPFMKGYHINDVYKAMCDCWQSPPINPGTKKPFYSSKPVLLADGAFDPACRPLYIDMIQHYMPNGQRLLYKNGSHMVLGGSIGNAFIRNFLNAPLTRLVSPVADITVQ